MKRHYWQEYEIKVGDKVYSFPTLGKLRKFIKKPEIGIKIKDYKVKRTIYTDTCSGFGTCRIVSVKDFYLF